MVRWRPGELGEEKNTIGGHRRILALEKRLSAMSQPLRTHLLKSNWGDFNHVCLSRWVTN